MTAPTAPASVEHVYLSTGCLHGHHDHCAAQVGTNGKKRPMTCKFCDARCICACHVQSTAVTT